MLSRVALSSTAVEKEEELLLLSPPLLGRMEKETTTEPATTDSTRTRDGGMESAIARSSRKALSKDRRAADPGTMSARLVERVILAVRMPPAGTGMGTGCGCGCGCGSGSGCGCGCGCGSGCGCGCGCGSGLFQNGCRQYALRAPVAYWECPRGSGWLKQRCSCRHA